MPEILVIEPIFAERIWGGTTLRDWYGDKVPPGVIGECWAVSGMPHRSGTITRGAPAGYTLAEAWREGLVTGEPRSDDFPLLCKILDPTDWLSVQVHPNDEEAQRLEGQQRGKAECWYVLAAEPGAELILGHRAGESYELIEALVDGNLLDLLIHQQVEAGSFFMVPAGCVHSVGPGLLIYEVQQSSDITYRLFDFERLGLDGQPRDLHIDKGFSVVTAPYDLQASLTAQPPVPTSFGSVRALVTDDHFAVSVWSVTGEAEVPAADFRIVTVIAGTGVVRAGTAQSPVPVVRGSSLVVPRGAGALTVAGDLRFVLTDPGPGL